MRRTPIVRSLLTVAGVILFIAPVLYASDHPLTATLTIVFLACWLLAAICLLAGNSSNGESHTPESSEPDKG